MSSIKSVTLSFPKDASFSVLTFRLSRQVQDLEKQLSSTKQQLHQLRSGVLKADSVMDIEFDMSGQPVLKLPDVGYRPIRQNRPTIPQDLSRVRANVRNHGYGIIKVPPPYRQVTSRSLVSDNGPALLPKPVADRLLAQYHTYVHTVMPIIHWPSFITEYESLYQRGTLRGTSRDWAAVLFGVMACGVMHSLEPNKQQEAQGYLLLSQTILDTWADEFSLDQARVALLASIALNEMNSRSSSWVWLGSAVRVAQDIGLHIESGPWSAVEREMRRRLWWGIYAWDRYGP
jgi:Fungal specific transcription factor domain